jgi:hypothetical protein
MEGWITRNRRGAVRGRTLFKSTEARASDGMRPAIGFMPIVASIANLMSLPASSVLVALGVVP